MHIRFSLAPHPQPINVDLQNTMSDNHHHSTYLVLVPFVCVSHHKENICVSAHKATNSQIVAYLLASFNKSSIKVYEEL